MNKEIEYELNKGIHLLPTSYKKLFPKKLHHITDKSPVSKLNWLVSIWAARELQQPAYLLTNPSPAESLTRYGYLKWKESI